MTDRRDLKRRVRARQERTGESYMTALRHVQAQRPSAIPTIERVDLTELGAPLGMKCRIAMFPELADRVDAATMLAQLRDAPRRAAPRRAARSAGRPHATRSG
ncbi:MAG TPA: hypothetical protein VNO30_48595 [Kofleriaceae bacterium]|nr:hypothetical protein [Kofleriaceae bacterium]